MGSLDDAVQVLAGTPAVVGSMLHGLPQEWTRFRPYDDVWSATDVVGHLIHGERTDWVPRAKVVLEHGESQPFTPFDREGWEDPPEDLDELLAAFASARAQSLAELESLRLDESDLARTGLHPDLGRVSLGQLVASWVVHDLSHVAQIGETMAKRYRAEVGPWRAYLPVLDRPELPD